MPRKSPPPLTTAALNELLQALTALEQRVPQSPPTWGPFDVAKKFAPLKRQYERLAAAPNRTEEQLLLLMAIRGQIDFISDRVGLVVSTCKRWRRLLKQAQALVELVKKQPGFAYAYRRRAYRKIYAQVGDLETIMRLLAVPIWIDELRDMDQALKTLRGLFVLSPPTAQEMQAVKAHLTQAETASYWMAQQTCTCRVCAKMRYRPTDPVDDEMFAEIKTCSCGVCATWRKLVERAEPTVRAYSRRNHGLLHPFLHGLGHKKHLN